MRKKKQATQVRLGTLICSKCGAEVPDGQLVCSCFLQVMYAEIESIALARFRQGGDLFRMDGARSGNHLLSVKGRGWTLCRPKLFKRASVARFPRHLLGDPSKARNLEALQKSTCPKCLDILLRSLSEGKSEGERETAGVSFASTR